MLIFCWLKGNEFVNTTSDPVFKIALATCMAKPMSDDNPLSKSTALSGGTPCYVFCLEGSLVGIIKTMCGNKSCIQSLLKGSFLCLLHES